MKKVVIPGIAFIIAGMQFLLWFSCSRLSDTFHLTFFDVSLKVDDFTHNDNGISFLLVRFFHNKITVFLIEFFRHFLRFWDVRFLTGFLSPIGFFALCAGIYFAVSKKNRVLPPVFLILFILQSIAVMIDQRGMYPIFIVLIWLLYQSISFYGLIQYIQGGKTLWRVVFCIFLILLSIGWYVVFKNDIYNFCTKII